MKEKIKNWLWKSDEEGITNFDAVCMFLYHLIAWSIVLFLGMIND